MTPTPSGAINGWSADQLIVDCERAPFILSNDHEASASALDMSTEPSEEASVFAPAGSRFSAQFPMSNQTLRGHAWSSVEPGHQGACARREMVVESRCPFSPLPACSSFCAASLANSCAEPRGLLAALRPQT